MTSWVDIVPFPTGPWVATTLAGSRRTEFSPLEAEPDPTPVLPLVLVDPIRSRCIAMTLSSPTSIHRNVLPNRPALPIKPTRAAWVDVTEASCPVLPAGGRSKRTGMREGKGLGVLSLSLIERGFVIEPDVDDVGFDVVFGVVAGNVDDEVGFGAVAGDDVVAMMTKMADWLEMSGFRGVLYAG